LSAHASRYQLVGIGHGGREGARVRLGLGGDGVVGFGRRLGHTLFWSIWRVGQAQVKVMVGGSLGLVGCTTDTGRLSKLFLFNNL
jgi:hypothetical protein